MKCPAGFFQPTQGAALIGACQACRTASLSACWAIGDGLCPALRRPIPFAQRDGDGDGDVDGDGDGNFDGDGDNDGDGDAYSLFLPRFVPCILMLLPFLNHCAQAPPPLQNLT